MNFCKKDTGRSSVPRKNAILVLLSVLIALFIVSCTTGSSVSEQDVKNASDILPADAQNELFQPQKECTTDSDCIHKGEGFACNCDGICIEADCTSDVHCGSESWCDDCLKQCKLRLPACSPCYADRQCLGEFSRCATSVQFDGLDIRFETPICAPWCPLSTGVCMVENAVQGAYVCAKFQDETNGVCIPKDLDCGSLPLPCTTDDDCKDPLQEKCYDDLHICGCRDTTSCPYGQACHPLTHQCVPGCTTDEECGWGRVCEASLCIAACSGDLASGTVFNCPETTPKPGAQWDCIDGHCRIPGMCFDSFDCPEPETYCNEGTNECVPGCQTDFDCKSAALECQNNVCVQRGCTRNFECAFKQVCNQDDNQCEEAEGKYCDVCDPQTENSCGDPDTLCVTFQDQDGNEKGSYCMPPCSDDPLNLCPQGWQCEEIQDSHGTSHGKKCVRFCYAEVAM